MSRQGISSRMEHPPLHRGTVPASPSPSPEPPVLTPPQRPQVTPVKPSGRFDMGKNKTKLIIVGAIVAVLILIAVVGGMALNRSGGSGAIDSSRYQAVFFTNGQVYFGKLHELGNGYMKLTNIFYLQTKTSTDSENPQKTDSEQDPGVVLIKLGDEIHGPEDEMIISKEQMLFFENLKPNGKVSETIKGYKPN